MAAGHVSENDLFNNYSTSARWIRASLAIYHLISNKREWNNCFIKNNQEMLLDHADFALQEQTEEQSNGVFS